MRLQTYIALLCLSCSALFAQDAPSYVAVVSGHSARIQGSTKIVDEGIAAASGAQIIAGDQNATLKLTRGGSIELCRSASLTMTSHGSELLAALPTGTIEARYPLSENGDRFTTSDFQLAVVSGAHETGALASFRLGLSRGGDLAVQVLPESAAGVEVSGNFDATSMLVQPGEMRAFPASGSKMTEAQILGTVALRCPLQAEPPERRVLQASASGSNERIAVPLTFSADAAPKPASAMATATNIVVATPVVLPQRTVEPSIALAQSEAIPQEPLLAVPKAHTGVFRSVARFFRHIFVGPSNAS